MTQAPAGWYADPDVPGKQSYWDGSTWRLGPGLATLDEVYAQQRDQYIDTLVSPNRTANRYIGFWRSAIKGLKQATDFRGRSSRSEYWWFYLFMMIVLAVPTMIGTILTFNAHRCADAMRLGFRCDIGHFDNAWLVAGFVVTIVFVLPHIAVTVRRLHDIGRTGWWAIVFAVCTYFGMISVSSVAISMVASFAALVGFIWQLVWFCRVGQDSTNQWGLVPDNRRVPTADGAA